MRADGWSDAKLRELVVAGGLQTGPFGGQLHADEYVADGVPVVMPQDIISGEISTEHIARVSEEKAASLAQHRLRTGDLVFARRGDIGRVGIARDRETGWLCGTGCLRARPSERVSPVYLHYAVRRASSIAWLNIHAVGQTMLNLNTSILGQLPADVPPLPEQRAIAAVLDTIDDAIQKTEQIIAKLQQVKQGLLHDLLTRGIDDNGELRDPERQPEQFQDSPLGRIPKGWEVVPLGSIALGGLVNGVFKEPGRAGRGIPLVNVGDLYGDFGVDLDRVEQFAANAVETSKFGVRPGDIYFTRSSLNLTGIAQCNIVRSADKAAVFECHVMRLRPDARRADAAFVALWCRAGFARSFFMSRAKQVTMTTISQPDIYPLPTPLPPCEEQRRIVDAIDSMDARLAREVLYAEKMRAEKHGVANDLLTGRVRTTSIA